MQIIQILEIHVAIVMQSRGLSAISGGAIELVTSDCDNGGVQMD
ncbi:MAG: hypothetical protein R2771_09160 [Saprospiraceae bacterium]